MKAEIDVLEKPEVSTGSQLQKLFVEVMHQHGVTEINNNAWLDINAVDVTKLPAPAVHDFVLEAEKLGHTVGVEKRTIIKVA
ncbi:MAG: hypothetical protein AAFO69_15135 [Bacteroidota bacterium]